MVAYPTSSDPIEIDDPGLKIKCTVIENVSQTDEKNSLKIQMKIILKLKLII